MNKPALPNSHNDHILCAIQARIAFLSREITAAKNDGEEAFPARSARMAEEISQISALIQTLRVSKHKPKEKHGNSSS